MSAIQALPYVLQRFNPHRVPGLPANPRSQGPQCLREASNEPHQIKGPDFKQPLASSVPRPPFQPNITHITCNSDSSGRNIRAPSIPSLSDASYCLPRDEQSMRRQDEVDVQNREASPREITPIWSRVTEVANSLTVSVSKAWAVSVPTTEGETTPPGHDSHLLRAMKAYHIANARDAADLPDWLFSEQERCIGGSRPRLAEIHSNDSDTPVAPLHKSLGTSRQTPHNSIPQSSKVADRLKLLRDAKSDAVYSGASANIYDGNTSLINGGIPSRRRQGLPSGPRRQ